MGEKRKRLEGKVVKEPPVIPCIVEELNHVLDIWIVDRIVRSFIVSRPPIEERERIPCFVESIIMSSTLLRIFGPSKGFFRRSSGRGPWSSPNRNLRYRGTLYLTIR